MSEAFNYILPHDLDVAGAQTARTGLLEAIEGAVAQGRLGLEVTGTGASQISIQLLFAGVLECRELGVELDLGPNAEAVQDLVHVLEQEA
ncbi:MAG: hypothetical protein ACJA1E_000362 [Paracoccaceae bacterium]|jgi:hypothetical protein